MATWAFYSDANLTNTVTGINVTASPYTTHLYFGSTTTGRKLTAQTGATGQIYVIPADSATGGHATTAIKLSSTSGGLSTASGGASLALGTSIVGGTANREDVWVQVTDAVGDGVLSTELSLTMTACYESAV